MILDSGLSAQHVSVIISTADGRTYQSLLSRSVQDQMAIISELWRNRRELEGRHLETDNP